MGKPASIENWRMCYEELAPKLLLFARQFVTAAADAEDIVQEAFVRFWRKQPSAGREHYPLLYSAVRSAALDLLRKDGRRIRRESSVIQSSFSLEESYFDPLIEQREDADALQAALERLPQAQREVLVLRIWSDLTFAQIASTLGESINTVTARYRYALEAMRRVIKPHEYERV